MVFCPEQLLRVILAHIHYMPDHWQGNAHRSQTRDEFAQLFQYKAVSGVGVRATRDWLIAWWRGLGSVLLSDDLGPFPFRCSSWRSY